MDYWHALTIPVSTPVTSPHREVMLLSLGVIREIMLFFPKGQRGYAHCRILRFEHQQWPTTPNAWYLGDGTVIEFPENYSLYQMPYEIILEGYNADPDHDHTVYVRVTVLREEELVIPAPPSPAADHPF